jgi:hypothetical protein
MNYNPIEIALILGNCKTKEEVYNVCYRFRYLIDNTRQKHKYLLERLSCKRIKYLIEKQN